MEIIAGIKAQHDQKEYFQHLKLMSKTIGPFGPKGPFLNNDQTRMCPANHFPIANSLVIEAIRLIYRLFVRIYGIPVQLSAIIIIVVVIINRTFIDD